jgi:alpha-1,2-mannosyltransferase
MNQQRFYTYLCMLFAFFLLLGGYAYLIVGGCAILAKPTATPALLDLTGRPVGADFIAYWAASRVAATGAPASVYDLQRLYVVERATIGADLRPMLWNYPPTFLLLILPLSLLPYLAALAVWLALTITAYLWVMQRLAPHPLTPWLALALPGAVNNFLYAQNGFLSTGIMGGGLLLLDRRPFTGGLLLGLLTYKPQLAVLIPVALVAGRYWRALAGAAVSAAVLALASLAVFGLDTWIAFYQHLPVAANLLNRGHLWGKMPTVFSAARLFGIGEAASQGLQGVAALAAAIAVIWVWRRKTPLAWRGSVLVLGTFLAVPYAFEYDLAILGLPFAWLGWQAYRRADLKEGAFLLACWAGFYLSGFEAAAAKIQAYPLFLILMLLFTVYLAARPPTQTPESP